MVNAQVVLLEGQGNPVVQQVGRGDRGLAIVELGKDDVKNILLFQRRLKCFARGWDHWEAGTP